MNGQYQMLRDRPKRPGMRTSMIASTVMYAITRGVTMERITAETGLLPSDLVDHGSWLPEALMLAIWRMMLRPVPAKRSL